MDPLTGWMSISTPSNLSNCRPAETALIKSYATQRDYLADNVIPATNISMSFVGATINLIFSFFVVYGVKHSILPFRGYILLLSRSFTDLLVSFVTCVFVCMHTIGSYNDTAIDMGNHTHVEYMIPHGRTMFTLLLTIDYWAVAGAYGLLALLPYIAVKKPVFYRTRITNKTTIYIMLVVWLVGAAYSTVVVLLSSNMAFNVFNDGAHLIEWSVSQEDYILAISNLCILLVAFCVVMFSYSATIIYLWRRSAARVTVSVYFASIKRMALSIACFALTCLVMASFVGLPIFLDAHLAHLAADSNDDICVEAIKAYQLGYIMTIWTTLAMIGWMLRIIGDPITTVMLDERFRKVVGKVKKRITNFFYPPIDESKVDNVKETTSGDERIEVGPSLTAIEFVKKCAELQIVPISVSGQTFRFRTPTLVDDSSSKMPKTKKQNHIRFEDLVL